MVKEKEEQYQAAAFMILGWRGWSLNKLEINVHKRQNKVRPEFGSFISALIQGFFVQSQDYSFQIVEGR